jgi:hypothetical protein
MPINAVGANWTIVAIPVGIGNFQEKYSFLRILVSLQSIVCIYSKLAESSTKSLNSSVNVIKETF